MSNRTAVSWNKEYTPDLIATRIEKCKRIDAEGRVAFAGFESNELTILLYSALEFPASIPEVEARGIVTQATFNVGAKRAISANSLLGEINRLTGDSLNRPLKPYVLISSISTDKHAYLPRVRINGASIAFVEQVPECYRAEIPERLFRRFDDYLFAKPPTNYQPLMARVSARSIYQAVDSALDAIDLVRGIWNWFLNRGHHIRISSGPYKPVNELILGPIHTLHEPQGKLAIESFWFEFSYRSPVKLRDLRPEIAKMNTFSKVVRHKLRSSKYRQDLEGAIIRYCRALDERDWNTSFLKLWSVLELLTNTAKLSNTITAKRAAFVFSDHEYQLQVLNHLRSYRNRAVHAGISTQEIESHLYQLKYCTEALLEFHLGNKFGFASLEEAGNFLQLPADSKTLKHRAMVAQLALKYRRC